MVRQIQILTAVVAAAAATALNVESAHGQVIIGRGGGGISINVPGIGGVRLGAPFRSRGVIVAPYGGVPYGYSDGYGGLQYGAPYGLDRRYAARPLASSRGNTIQSLPTVDELQSMADSELLNAVVGLMVHFDADLNRFDTADTWQRYFRLPESALPPADDAGRVRLGRDALVEALKRFDLTAANPRYTQISGLPSYIAAHAALEELVGRFGDEAGEPSIALRSAVPPAAPTPPQPSPGADDDYLPRSIEMRNLHAAPERPAPAEDAINAQPASAAGPSAEELPAPPPSLVPPSNDLGSERSILSR